MAEWWIFDSAISGVKDAYNAVADKATDLYMQWEQYFSDPTTTWWAMLQWVKDAVVAIPQLVSMAAGRAYKDYQEHDVDFFSADDDRYDIGTTFSNVFTTPQDGYQKAFSNFWVIPKLESEYTSNKSKNRAEFAKLWDDISNVSLDDMLTQKQKDRAIWDAIDQFIYKFTPSNETDKLQQDPTFKAKLAKTAIEYNDSFSKFSTPEVEKIDYTTDIYNGIQEANTEFFSNPEVKSADPMLLSDLEKRSASYVDWFLPEVASEYNSVMLSRDSMQEQLDSINSSWADKHSYKIRAKKAILENALKEANTYLDRVKQTNQELYIRWLWDNSKDFNEFWQKQSDLVNKLSVQNLVKDPDNTYSKLSKVTPFLGDDYDNTLPSVYTPYENSTKVWAMESWLAGMATDASNYFWEIRDITENMDRWAIGRLFFKDIPEAGHIIHSLSQQAKIKVEDLFNEWNNPFAAINAQEAADTVDDIIQNKKYSLSRNVISSARDALDDFAAIGAEIFLTHKVWALWEWLSKVNLLPKTYESISKILLEDISRAAKAKKIKQSVSSMWFITKKLAMLPIRAAENYSFSVALNKYFPESYKKGWKTFWADTLFMGIDTLFDAARASKELAISWAEASNKVLDEFGKRYFGITDNDFVKATDNDRAFIREASRKAIDKYNNTLKDITKDETMWQLVTNFLDYKKDWELKDLTKLDPETTDMKLWADSSTELKNTVNTNLNELWKEDWFARRLSDWAFWEWWSLFDHPVRRKILDTYYKWLRENNPELIDKAYWLYNRSLTIYWLHSWAHVVPWTNSHIAPYDKLWKTGSLRMSDWSLYDYHLIYWGESHTKGFSWWQYNKSAKSDLNVNKKDRVAWAEIAQYVVVPKDEWYIVDTVRTDWDATIYSIKQKQLDWTIKTIVPETTPSWFRKQSIWKPTTLNDHSDFTMFFSKYDRWSWEKGRYDKWWVMYSWKDIVSLKKWDEIEHFTETMWLYIDTEKYVDTKPYIKVDMEFVKKQYIKSKQIIEDVNMQMDTIAPGKRIENYGNNIHTIIDIPLQHDTPVNVSNIVYNVDKNSQKIYNWEEYIDTYNWIDITAFSDWSMIKWYVNVENLFNWENIIPAIINDKESEKLIMQAPAETNIAWIVKANNIQYALPFKDASIKVKDEIVKKTHDVFGDDLFEQVLNESLDIFEDQYFEWKKWTKEHKEFTKFMKNNRKIFINYSQDKIIAAMGKASKKYWEAIKRYFNYFKQYIQNFVDKILSYLHKEDKYKIEWLTRKKSNDLRSYYKQFESYLLNDWAVSIERLPANERWLKNYVASKILIDKVHVEYNVWDTVIRATDMFLDNTKADFIYYDSKLVSDWKNYYINLDEKIKPEAAAKRKIKEEALSNIVWNTTDEKYVSELLWKESTGQANTQGIAWLYWSLLVEMWEWKKANFSTHLTQWSLFSIVEQSNTVEEYINILNELVFLPTLTTRIESFEDLYWLLSSIDLLKNSESDIYKFSKKLKQSYLYYKWAYKNGNVYSFAGKIWELNTEKVSWHYDRISDFEKNLWIWKELSIKYSDPNYQLNTADVNDVIAEINKKINPDNELLYMYNDDASFSFMWFDKEAVKTEAIKYFSTYVDWVKNIIDWLDNDKLSLFMLLKWSWITELSDNIFEWIFWSAHEFTYEAIVWWNKYFDINTKTIKEKFDDKLTEVRWKMIYNTFLKTKKYVKKMISSTNDILPLEKDSFSVLVLDDIEEFNDWEFLWNKTTVWKSLRTVELEKWWDIPSSVKVQYNWKWFGIKWLMSYFETNKLYDYINSSKKNFETTKQYLIEHWLKWKADRWTPTWNEAKMLKSSVIKNKDAYKYASYMYHFGVVDIILPHTSYKMYVKSKAYPKSFYIDSLKYYNNWSTLYKKWNLEKISWQVNQSLQWDISNELNNYIKEYQQKNNFLWNQQRALELYAEWNVNATIDMILSYIKDPAIINKIKSWDTRALASYMFSIISDNNLASKIPWEQTMMVPVSVTEHKIIKELFKDVLKWEDKYMIIPRVRWWGAKLWDNIVILRHPVIWPKSIQSVKVIYIEDILNKTNSTDQIKADKATYIYSTVASKARDNVVMPKPLADWVQWDYDWDRIVIFPALSLYKSKWSKITFWDKLKNYLNGIKSQNVIESKRLTSMVWSITEIQSSVVWSKLLTATASNSQRVMWAVWMFIRASIETKYKWAEKTNMLKKLEQDINNAYANTAQIIQDAVDWNIDVSDLSVSNAEINNNTKFILDNLLSSYWLSTEWSKYIMTLESYRSASSLLDTASRLWKTELSLTKLESIYWKKVIDKLRNNNSFWYNNIPKLESLVIWGLNRNAWLSKEVIDSYNYMQYFWWAGISDYSAVKLWLWNLWYVKIKKFNLWSKDRYIVTNSFTDDIAKTEEFKRMIVQLLTNDKKLAEKVAYTILSLENLPPNTIKYIKSNFWEVFSYQKEVQKLWHTEWWTTKLIESLKIKDMWNIWITPHSMYINKYEWLNPFITPEIYKSLNVLTDKWHNIDSVNRIIKWLKTQWVVSNLDFNMEYFSYDNVFSVKSAWSNTLELLSMDTVNNQSFYTNAEAALDNWLDIVLGDEIAKNKDIFNDVKNKLEYVWYKYDNKSGVFYKELDATNDIININKSNKLDNILDCI